MDLIIGIGPSIGDELNRVMTLESGAINFEEAERAEQWDISTKYIHPVFVRVGEREIFRSCRDSQGVHPYGSELDWKPYYLQEVDGVIYSYEHVVESKKRYTELWKRGIKKTYRVPRYSKLFLDNGSFGFSSKGYTGSLRAYEIWADKMNADWKPMPRDYIPWIAMSDEELTENMYKTLRNNIKYSDQDYAMIFHSGPRFEDYLTHFQAEPSLRSPKYIALGSIHGKVQRHDDLIYYVNRSKEVFPDSHLHLFGVGSMRSTVHLSALLQADSIDSAGWYVTSSRLGQVTSPNPQKGSIAIAEHLNERQGKPTASQLDDLSKCECYCCQNYPLEVFQSDGLEASTVRAGHNLYHLMKEKALVEYHLTNGTYDEWQRERNPGFYKKIQLGISKYNAKQLDLLPQDRSKISYYDFTNGYYNEFDPSIYRHVEFGDENFDLTQSLLFDLPEIDIADQIIRRSSSGPRAPRRLKQGGRYWIITLNIEDEDFCHEKIVASTLIRAKDKARELALSTPKFVEMMTTKPRWVIQNDKGDEEIHTRHYEKAYIKLQCISNDEEIEESITEKSVEEVESVKETENTETEKPERSILRRNARQDKVDMNTYTFEI